MQTPEWITFTGVDSRMDLDLADALARNYPIEWGLVGSSMNHPSRFPPEQVDCLAAFMAIAGRKAFHACGKVAKRLQAGELPDYLDLHAFDRLQVNGAQLDEHTFDRLRQTYGIAIIKQWTDEVFATDQACQLLFDRSGGRGLSPECVPPLPPQDIVVGYSGGIGPDNVCAYLDRIEGTGRFWIDMQHRVRTDGWLDLNKVRHVCEAVYG